MTNEKYEAVLFAPDGASVRDARAESVEAVWNRVNDFGSRWYFYPVAFVVRKDADKNTGRIVSAPDMLQHYKGRTLATFRKDMLAKVESLPATADVETLLYSL